MNSYNSDLNIPDPIPLDIFIGTLVINKVMGNLKVLRCPFVVVAFFQDASQENIKKYPVFLSNAESLSEACQNMDYHQEDWVGLNGMPPPMTVYKFYYKGDTVVHADFLPDVPIEV